MEYVIHRTSECELYHHGIKGMKWGVRRYQNKDGSLTDKGKKRASDYRNKEIKRLDKKYSTNRIDKRIAKTTQKIKDQSSKPEVNTKKVDRLVKKLNNDSIRSYYKQGMKAAEKDALKKMSIKDVDNERIEVGKLKAKNAAAFAGSVALKTFTGVGVYARVDIDTYKTNARVSGAASDRAAKDAVNKAAKDVTNVRKNR